MSEYEQETLSTVELALAVEGLGTRAIYFDGLDDTLEIFKTYTKAHIREVIEGRRERIARMLRVDDEGNVLSDSMEDKTE